MLDQLERVYTAEFGAPVYPEYGKYLRKKLPHDSFLVANLASHCWLVWAPTGHPRRQRSRPQEGGVAASFEALSSSPTFMESEDQPALGEEVVSTGHVHEDVEKEHESRENFLPDPYLSTASYLLHSTASKRDDDCIIDLSGIPRTSKPAAPKEDPNLEPISAPTAKLEPNDPISTPSPKFPIFVDSLGPSHVSRDEEGGRESSTSSQSPESPYDFLKNHPDLIAELSKPSNFADVETDLPEDDLRVLTEVLALQRLQELGIGVVRNPAPPPSSSSAPPPPPSPSSSFLDPAEAVGGSSVPVPAPPHPQAHHNPPWDSDNHHLHNWSAAEYLESGLSPDQVLAELQQLKERCGGVLRPEQMSPFLDYFGELSSRELDRIEALEGGKKPKKGGGGGGGRKRNMAIRFPSQQPDRATAATTTSYNTQFDKSLFTGKLPVADFDTISDSSSDDDAPVIPINRNEYIRRFLEGGDPDNNILSEDELSLLHSKDEEPVGSSSVGGSGRSYSGEQPRPLLPPSQSGTDGSFEAIFDPSKMKF